jgi:ABC-type dipeptide/oligopeptide/nickel transport system permease component
VARFLARRVLGSAATLVGVLVAVFLLVSAAPGDPARLTMIGHGPIGVRSPEALAAFRSVHGLDRPLPERLLSWLGSAACLDLGRSFRDGRRLADRRDASVMPRERRRAPSPGPGGSARDGRATARRARDRFRGSS